MKFMSLEYIQNKLFILLLNSIFLFRISSFAQSASQLEIVSYLKDLPFKIGKIEAPNFKEKYFNITKYGAINDGITKNTKAIQNAIDECHRLPGHFRSGRK